MRTLDSILDEYSDDVGSVSSWCEDIYDELFEPHFRIVFDLYNRMNSNSHEITDEELHSILIDLPVELFAASESLNNLRRNLEVIKLKNKDMKRDVKSSILVDAEQAGMKLSQAELTEVVSAKMVEYELPVLAFTSIITQVENQMSFARELIMGAKKIFDSRRTAEKSNPVGEVVPDENPDEIPDYDPDMKNKSYIK